MRVDWGMEEDNITMKGKVKIHLKKILLVNGIAPYENSQSLIFCYSAPGRLQELGAE
jgi:hypothetical protein